MNFDEFAFRAVSEIRSPALNRILIDISSLGSTPVVTIQAVIAGVFIILILHSRLLTVRLGVATGGCALWIEILKQVFRRARPETIEHLVNVRGFSFPSGHAAASAALYITLALILSPHLEKRARIAVRVIATILIALIALSRVYLGVHYASDVAGGLVLGIGWSWVTLKLLPQAAAPR